MPLHKMWISFNTFLRGKKNSPGKYFGEIHFESFNSSQVQFFQQTNEEVHLPKWNTVCPLVY